MNPGVRIQGAPLRDRLAAVAADESRGLNFVPTVQLLGVDFGDPRSSINVRIHKNFFESIGLNVRCELLSDADGSVQEALVRRVEEANADDGVDAVMVLLPVPENIDLRKVIASIDPLKEVEGLHMRHVLRNHPLAPPEPVLPWFLRRLWPCSEIFRCRARHAHRGRDLAAHGEQESRLASHHG